MTRCGEKEEGAGPVCFGVGAVMLNWGGGGTQRLGWQE